MNRHALCLLATISVAQGHQVFAQEGSADVTAPAVDSGTIFYDQAYFSTYGVQNADDMLRRIPGVPAILAGIGSNTQSRGFGSGGDQILVMGHRFPGKANEISKILTRLRASDVERVELIRGGSKDIDVRSSGIVVNIILKPGASLGGGGNFEVNLRGNDERFIGVDGLLNYAGSSGRLGYTLGIERNLWSPPTGPGARWSNRFRDEIYRFPSGAVQELRPQDWRRDHDKLIYTAGLTYDFNGGGRAQLNGLYQTLTVKEFDETPLVRFNAAGAEILRATEVHQRNTGKLTLLEIGGDYRVSLGTGELTTLFIVNRRTTPTLDFRNRIEPARTVELSKSLSEVKLAEDILRAQYSFGLSPDFNVEVGAEGARNTLRQNLQPFFDLNADGRVEPITIPTSDARVKEIRGEAFINANWTASARLSLNGSLNFEASKLTTNSVFNPGRSLKYMKPRLDARYKASANGQLRFLIDRTISQLDFANFVPSYNVVDDRVDAGNPGLLPERVWVFELGYEHRLLGDAGVIEGKVFYNDITDPIDRIPYRQGAFIVSAQGNLESGKLYGAEAKASLRLIPLGLRDAVLTLRGLVQESETTDPFTGAKRRLRADARYAFDVGFRHDLKTLQFSYGVDYKNVGTDVIQSDLFSRDIYRVGPALEVFAEKRLTTNFLVRFEAQNLLGGKEYRSRTIYSTNQIDGTVRRLDSFVEDRDLRYAVRIRGTF